MSAASQAPASAPAHETEAEARRYRALERAWQDDVGYALLDKPYELPGAAALSYKQWDGLIAKLPTDGGGLLVEIGCGRGHLLQYLRDHLGRDWRFLGLELSRAVFNLRQARLAGVNADGEALPLRDHAARCVVFHGSLHHMIDYAHALREAVRVLAPAGTLIIYEPVSSRFSQLMHRLLDPIVFRTCVYESPIDIRYKKDFREAVILDVLRACNLRVEIERSDFLAYPFTGCYAGSPFARSLRFMRCLMWLEDRIAATPVLGTVARRFAWRVTIVARN